MSLPPPGIIVVNRNSVISQQGDNNLSTVTTSIAPSNNRQNSHNRTQIHNQQQQKLKTFQIHRLQENDSSLFQTVSAKIKNFMHRQQHTSSSSSSPPSSVSPSSVASSFNATFQHQQNNKTGITFINTSPQSLSSQNQMNQQQKQIHHHQSQHYHTTSTAILQSGNHSKAQQIIQVSEEFVGHATGTATATNLETTTANVINLATENEIINQTQIIKLVSDRNGSNVIIDSLGNVTATTTSTNYGDSTSHNIHNHPTSKLFVSNLTVLPSKQNSLTAAGQQFKQSVSFVNAKSLPYLNTSGNNSCGNVTVTEIGNISTNNSGIKTQQHQTVNSNVKKVVNIPLKTNSFVKNIHQQQLHQNQHNVSINNATTVIQKIVPKNAQMIARIQNTQPQSTTAMETSQEQQQKQVIHHSYHNVQNNQMILQQKYVNNIVAAPSNVINNNKSTTKINNSLKKHQTLLQSVKSHQQNKINVQGHKTVLQQQAQQFQRQSTSNVKQVKSQRVIKQLSTTGIFTNLQNLSQTASVLPIVQHQTQQTISTENYAISNAVKVSVQQQYKQSKDNHTTEGILIKNSPTKTVTTKYIMQNHIVPATSAITSVSNSSTFQQNQHLNKNENNNNQTSNVVMQQQTINTVNSPIVTVHSNQSGTLKFTNTHQQSPQTHKIRNNIYHPIQQQFNPVHQQQDQYTEGENNLISTTRTIGSCDNTNNRKTVNSCEDIVVVNGTQMTDEISARILQSMSQKSSFKNQQRQFQRHKNPSSPAPLSTVSSQITNYLLSSTTIPSEYPIYNLALCHHDGISQTSLHSHQGQRSQSSDLRHHYEQHHEIPTVTTKKSTEFFKVNAKDIQAIFSPSMTFIDYIPLHCPLQRGDDTLAAQQAVNDDNIIGEEVRPTVPVTTDSKLQALYAFLLDHNYVAAIPTCLPLETATIPVVITTSAFQRTPIQQQQQAQQQPSSAVVVVPPFSSNNNDSTVSEVEKNSLKSNNAVYTISAINNCVSPTEQRFVHVLGQNKLLSMNHDDETSDVLLSQRQYQQQKKDDVVVDMDLISGSCGKGLSSTSVTTRTEAFSLAHEILTQRQRELQHHDDDANSVISNESRNGHNLENDLGEETETAPEAEGEDEDEDDSITRCICDLTHDDGYMICCDKCSAWQHVDCVGIDRQNIPDEYLCEICQPRPVDKARAISLQLLKKKEQTQILVNTAQLNAAGTANNILGGGGILMQQEKFLINNGGIVGSSSTSHTQSLDHALPDPISSRVTNSIGKKSGKLMGGTKKRVILKKKKKEKPSIKKRNVGSASGNSSGGVNNKRTAKRKTKASNSNEITADKYASNLRQWIENYELAMTNHYSPELRARLHAINKQNLLQNITATENKILRNLNGNLENNCTTVPHAGGKILISKHDIQPNSAIIELRGKYMLTTQYKNQNPSVFMNSSPNNSGLHHNLGQYQKSYQKIPGPFIFFYHLSLDTTTSTKTATNTLNGGLIICSNNGPEICVDTRTYGNEARFVRRSCRPNAEIQHSFEKGTIHLYLVSLTNIKASTEITIRHEPHDLIAIGNRNNFNFPISPTSTICACGLTKECIFNGNQLPMQMITTNVQNKAISRKTTINGYVGGETGKTSSNVSKKKKSQDQNRGISISSSRESNIGLISPTNTNFTQNSHSSTTSVLSLSHDTGVCTSSSPPVSLPSPAHIQIINSPSQKQTSLISSEIKQKNIQASGATADITLMATVAEKTETVIQSPLKSRNCDNEYAISGSDISNTSNNLVKHQPLIKTSQKPVSSNPRKTLTKKTRPSISEDCGSSSQQEEKHESRKLTREERKMEAIVKAFEKMEKNQQRKQELKAKILGVADPDSNKRRHSELLSPKRAKISSNDTENNSISFRHHTTAGRKPGSTRRNKKKSSKSYHSQASIQRKKSRTKINSNESDVKTSEESSSFLSSAAIGVISSINKSSMMEGALELSSCSIPLQPPLIDSSKISKIVKKQMTLMTNLIESQEVVDGGLSQAAGLLMAFANPVKKDVSRLHSPSTNSIDSSDTSYTNAVDQLQVTSTTEFIKEQQQKNQEQCHFSNTSILNPHLSISSSSSIIASSMRGNNNASDNNSNVINKLSLRHHRPSVELTLVNQNQQLSLLQNSPQTPPIVSSTCLLVEAAVGPLENFENNGNEVAICNDFKIPLRTKTKKSIMNDWLNQSSDVSSDINQSNEVLAAPITKTTEKINHQKTSNIDNYHHNHGKSLDTLVEAAASICNYQPINSTSSLETVTTSTEQPAACIYISAVSEEQKEHHQKQIEPQNLRTVTKKVEQLIHERDADLIVYSSVSPHCSEETIKMSNDDSPSVDISHYSTVEDQIVSQNCNQTSLNLHNLNTIVSLNSLSGNSSVKKRWLRQAISEETDEIYNTINNRVAMCASSPIQQQSPTPPSGFTTPLKKRRVIRQCNNNDDEQSSNSSPEDMSSTVSTLTKNDDTGEQENFGNSNNVENEAEKIALKVVNVNMEMVVKNKSSTSDNDSSNGATNSGEMIQKLSNESEDNVVDIITSPLPNEKIITDDRSLVKIEPEDISIEIKVDVEKEEGSSNDDSVTNINSANESIVTVFKTNDTNIGISVKTEAKLNLSNNEVEEIEKKEKQKVEQYEGKSTKFKTEFESISVSQCEVAASITDEKSSTTSSQTPLTSLLQQNSLSLDSLNYENLSDEIADIQKRLHSFHTENIMILQSRNKLKISRSLKTNSSNKNSSGSMKNDEKTGATSLMIDEKTMKSYEIKENSKLEKSTVFMKTNKKDKYNRHSKNSKKRVLSKTSKEQNEIIVPKKLRKTGKSSDRKCKYSSSFMFKLDNEKMKTKDAETQIKAEQSFDRPTTTMSMAKDNNITLSNIDDKQLKAALTIPSFNQNIMSSAVEVGVAALQQNPFSSYITNMQHPSIDPVIAITSPINHQSYDTSTFLASSSPPPPPPIVVTETIALTPGTVQNHNSKVSLIMNFVGQQHSSASTPSLNLPYYNTIYGKFTDKIPDGGNSAINHALVVGNSNKISTSPIVANSNANSNLLLSDYLDTKAKSYGTLGGYVSHSALFGLSSGKINISTRMLHSSNSSNKAGVSITNSLDSVLSNAMSTRTIAASKILTKTASSDPRLNPILTAPEPAPPPKRKLSINEYRKRKQQSAEAVSTMTAGLASSALSQSGNAFDASRNTFTTINSNYTKSTISSTNNSNSIFKNVDNINNETETVVETSKIQFSSAPTMLEQQQEILCKRLKSLKSKAAVVASLGANISSSVSSIVTSTSSFSSPSLSSSSSTLSLSSLKSIVIDNNDENFNINNVSTTDSFVPSSQSIQQQLQLPKIIMEGQNNLSALNSNKNNQKSLESLSLSTLTTLSSVSLSEPETLGQLTPLTPTLLECNQKSLSVKCDQLNNFVIPSSSSSKIIVTGTTTTMSTHNSNGINNRSNNSEI